MSATLPTGWAELLRPRRHPLELQAVLITPLYTRPVSLVVGHIAAICLCLVAVARVPGSWPHLALLASTVAMAARLGMLVIINNLGPQPQPQAMLRWLPLYVLVGMFWVTATSVTCGLSVLLGDDEITRLVAIVIVFGTSAGIASRNARTPRFALAQLAVMLLPTLGATIWLGSWYWVLTGIMTLYFMAMMSIVRQQNGDFMSLIESERQSRLAQRTLEEREAELRAVFENAAVGCVEFDPATSRMLRVNRVFCRMVGRSEEELLAAIDLSALTHPDDRAAERERWAAIRTTGHSFQLERRYMRPDGGIFWAHVSVAVAAMAADGSPARMVSIVLDITERREAEAALRHSQEMLRLSLDVARIGSYRRDLRTHDIHCGPGIRQLHGYPPGEGPVPNAVWRAMLVPEDLERIDKQLLKERAEQKPVISLQYRFHHPVDGLRHIETRSRMTYDADGLPLETNGVAIDVTDRHAAEQRVAHLAHHDPLTGLPNRALLRIRLDEAVGRAQRGEAFALLCLDLDHFKEVNDTLGHPVGDALLQEVTERLKAAVRPTDTVARLGGDEFAIVQSKVEHAADAATLAGRVIAALSTPFSLDGHHVVIGTSIGVAKAPDDGLDPVRLLRNADLALYGAKADGRGCFRFFEPELDARAQARRALEADLRNALAHEEFEVFYQPLVDVATRRVRCFEALLRWRQPIRGMVMPDRFVPLAESIGLIIPIGTWVLRRACADAASWPGRLRVAVNLSAVQFSNPLLVSEVATALRLSGLPPEQLELEITETAMLHDTEVTLATLHQLKALGIGIALDDFGTGYSSLSYLQRFPFDKVKIDRSFVAQIGHSRQSAAIVGAVIDLCASLDMRTAAEGVETESQFEAVARIGCHEAQGYLFSPPRPAAEVEAIIHRCNGPVGMLVGD